MGRSMKPVRNPRAPRRYQDAAVRSASERRRDCSLLTPAKVLQPIEHACIVQVSDYGRTDDGLSHSVMEFLRGEPLSRRLQRLR